VTTLMRCLYCGLLQDEPPGVKECSRCGGELTYESQPTTPEEDSYLQIQMELDQVQAPAGRNLERYLLITLRTPVQVPAKYMPQTEKGRPSVNFTAVLDVSGSMQGEKIRQAKEAVRQSLRYLNQGDILALITFSDDSRCIMEPASLNQQSRMVVESALHEMQANGMTALCGGLELGIEKAKMSKQENNLVLMLSDGQANVGETDLEKIALRARQARENGLIVSAIGVGMDYNEALLAAVANQGGGRYYHIQNPAQIGPYLTGELGEVAALAVRDLRVELEIPKGAVLLSLTEAYPVEIVDGITSIHIGALPSDLELEIPLQLVLPAQPEGSRLSITGEVKYQSPNGTSLHTKLNRVTIRFVPAKDFQLKGGAVTPVIERVAQHLQAAAVMDVSRAMAVNDAAARQHAQIKKNTLKEYFALLDDKKATALMEEIDLDAMRASPAQAKSMVSNAFRYQRRSKKFDQ
jgi:Ca-activated chloride channel family protein